MTSSFQPQLNCLPPPQRLLRDELGALPEEFVLYFRTALALHLGRRESVDFDFFGNRPSDPARLKRKMPFLPDASITQQETNTLSVLLNRKGPIKVSFFGVPGIRRLRAPHRAPDNWFKPCSIQGTPNDEIASYSGLSSAVTGGCRRQ